MTQPILYPKHSLTSHKVGIPWLSVERMHEREKSFPETNL